MRKQTAFDRLAKQTHRWWFSVALTALRIALGSVFLFSGIAKMSGWSAAGYLQGATGPFADWFISLAGNPLVDQLNIWGLTLVGAGLLLGFLVRPAAFFGVIIMGLYYLSAFEQNTQHGLIDEHVVYLLVLFLFLSGGVGHILGVDGIVYQRIRSSRSWLRFIFG